jgi:hypothetical protein
VQRDENVSPRLDVEFTPASSARAASRLARSVSIIVFPTGRDALLGQVLLAQVSSPLGSVVNSSAERWSMRTRLTSSGIEPVVAAQPRLDVADG